MLHEPPFRAPPGEAPFTLEEGLAEARAQVANLIAIDGTPGDLAARHGVTREWLKPFLDFLRPIEHFVRRLIFALAAETAASMAAPALAAPKQTETKQRAAPAPRTFDPASLFVTLDEDVSTWRVRFRMLEPARLPAARTARARGEPRRRVLAAPYALRLEAIRRLLADPIPFIMRLAKRLRAGAKIPIKLKLPKSLSPKDCFGLDWHGYALVLARRAIAWRDTS